jgi:hypothetical protein
MNTTYYTVESDGLKFVLGETWVLKDRHRRFFALDGTEYPEAPASSWELFGTNGNYAYETLDAALAALRSVKP